MTTEVKTFLAQYTEALRKRQTNIRTTYQLPEAYAPIAFEILKATYRDCVERREQDFVEDREVIDKITKAAAWLCANKKKFGLLLSGGVGNGKTALANAICTMLETITKTNRSLAPFEFRRVSAIELSNIAIGDSERFAKTKRCEYLLIDDIGAEPVMVKNYGNEISAVVELIYDRYDSRLFTIATSNLNDKQLAERYEIRIFDRITEMFNKIGFKNKSFRK
jgi:DNA replication protein DnaC